jgi:hypothetical protein
MKKIIAATLTLSAMALFLTFNSTFAGDRVKVYELTESGVTIEFPMTAEEIEAENAETLSATALFPTYHTTLAGDRVKIYELAESGFSIEYPMTAEEIGAEDAENARLADLLKTNSSKPTKQVIKFELAEDGEIIEFPVKSVYTTLNEFIH